MSITRKEAEDLILETYVQLAEPLRRLYSMISKTEIHSFGSMQSNVIITYKSYCDTLSIREIRGNIREKVLEQLMPDLQMESDDTVIEILTECREIAQLYQLIIYSEIPKGDIVIERTNVITHSLGRIQYDTHLGRFFLYPIKIEPSYGSPNVLLKNYLMSLYSNFGKTYDIYENIQKNMSDLENYISYSQKGLEFLVGLHQSLSCLNPLMDILSDAREEIKLLSSHVEKLDFNGMEIYFENYSLSDIFGDIARSISPLMRKIKNKADTLSESSTDSSLTEPTEDDNQTKEEQSRINAFLERSREYLSEKDITVTLTPPRFDWEGNLGEMSFVPSAETSFSLSYATSQNSSFNIELSGNPLNHEFSARVGRNYINRNLTSYIEGNINRTNHDTTLNVSLSTILNLNDFFRIETNSNMLFSTKNRAFSLGLFNLGFIFERKF